MGQVASNLGSQPKQEDTMPGVYETCRRRLEHVERLLAEPDQLEKECDFQFQRAPLDSHGEMRRIELRRLLWTFAHHLGSEDLTWEAIEVAAVVGTLEPHMPVVTRAEFFRCVLKTVHLVAAELRTRLEEARSVLERRAAEHAEAAERAAAEAARGQAAAKARQRPPPHAQRATHADSDSGDENSDSSEDSQTDSSDTGKTLEVPMFAPAPAGESIDAVGPTELLAPPGYSVPQPPCEQQEEEIFAPAPGGTRDDAAAINGMMALTLSTEGSFDPQRIFVGRGQLIVREPEENESDERPTGFDLRLLEMVHTGESIQHAPSAALLPGFARGPEALDRMLMLEFDAGEALCLWFPTVEDCSLCLQAIKEEAMSALEAGEPNASGDADYHHQGGAASWIAGIFGRGDKEDDG